jgi:hypothetical protein
LKKENDFTAEGAERAEKEKKLSSAISAVKYAD